MENEERREKSNSKEKETSDEEKNKKPEYKYLESDPNGDEVIEFYEESCLKSTPDLKNLAEYVKKATSSKRFDKLMGVVMLRKLLSLPEDTPIQEFLDTGITEDLKNIIENSEEQLLRAESVWCFTNAFIGNCSQVSFLDQKKVIELLISCLKDKYDILMRRAIWALGNVAATNTEFRDKLINLEVMETLVEIFGRFTKEEMDDDLLNTIIFASSNLSKSTPAPAYLKIANGLPMFIESINLLTKHPKKYFENLDEILRNSLVSLSKIVTTEAETEMELAKKLGLIKILMNFFNETKNLEEMNWRTLYSLLRIIGTFSYFSDENCVEIVKNGGLDLLQRLLKLKKFVLRKLACWVLSNITAGGETLVENFIAHHNLYSDLMRLGTEDEELDVRREAIIAVCKLMNSPSAEHLVYFLRENIVEFLGNVFRREDDDYIRNVGSEAVFRILLDSKTLLGVPQGPGNPIVQKFRRIGLFKILVGLSESGDTSDQVKTRLRKIMSRFFDCAE